MYPLKFVAHYTIFIGDFDALFFSRNFEDLEINMISIRTEMVHGNWQLQ